MPSDSRTGDRVRDDTGIEYVLGETIGKPGAQGAVHRIDGQPGFAIKLLFTQEDSSGPNQGHLPSRNAAIAGVEAVRRLPLDGLNLAAPISLIRDGGTGYLMPLAADMNPLGEPYLPFEFTSRELNTIDWYRNTGGVRRRLAIAASVAECLAALHERGLAYVDLNPNNVMVSNDVSRQETWLIDTDNLTSRANPRSNILGFPGYIAPERAMRKAPPSTLADSYAMAVMVFRLLVLRHPLEGRAEEAQEFPLLREKYEALHTDRWPYVGDPHDDTNRLPDKSLPSKLYEIALSGRMQQLLVQTFTAGRQNPLSRPGTAKWRDALWLAHDNVVDCDGGCGWSYYRLIPQCPACGSRTPPVIMATVFPEWGESEWPGVTPQARDSLVLSRRRVTTLEERHLWGRYTSRDPMVAFRPVPRGFELTTDETAVVTDGKGRRVERIPYPESRKEYRVRVESSGRPARTLRLTSIEAR